MKTLYLLHSVLRSAHEYVRDGVTIAIFSRDLRTRNEEPRPRGEGAGLQPSFSGRGADGEDELDRSPGCTQANT